MKTKIFILLFNICCYSQNEEIKKGKVLNTDNTPLKNVYIINSECKVTSISNNEGIFTYTGNIDNLEFVKKGMEKIHSKNEESIQNVYLKKNKIEIEGKTSNFIGIYPTRNVKVNGLALNLMTDFEDGTERSTITNGIEIDIDLFSAMLALMSYVHIGSEGIHSEPSHCQNSFKLIKKINGFNFNLLSLKPMITNGVYIGTSLSTNNITNGISCSLLTNQNSKINGISISVFGNHDISCNGIQIGLVNSSSNLKGIQIGLWNKNQKRTLPFINWNFK